jgi:hypothetical protein
VSKGNGHSNLFKRTKISVDHAGEIVTLKFGNVVIDMHYTDSLPFSQALRLHSKASKRESRDFSRIVSCAGILSDAEENYKRGI